MLVDYHVHTEFSDDSETSMKQMVEAAIRFGIEEICFTDHVDYGVKIDHVELRSENQNIDTRVMNVDYPRYFNEIRSLKELYDGQINIRTGLEFGVQLHTIPNFKKVFKAYKLDFVILSCHQVENKEFWTNEFQEGRTPEEYNERYYEEIYRCICNYKDYSVLGHLDMIQRYNSPRYPFKKSKSAIEKILSKVIEDNKGLEINMSCFRYGLSDLMPAKEILKLYFEMGGRILTLGSDAHREEDLGDCVMYFIMYVRRILRGIGFKEFCTFEQMQPIFHKL